MTDARARPISARAAFGAALRILRARPLSLFVILGVVPAVWDVPLDVVRRSLLPAEAPAVFDPSYAMTSQALWFASCLWSAVPLGGSLLASLSAIRGAAISLQQFVRGVRYVGPLALAGFLIIYPVGILFDVVLPLSGHPGLFLGSVFLFAFWLYFVGRSFCVIPLIVDHRLPLLQSFRVSWHITRQAHWAVLRLIGIVGVTCVSLAVLLPDTAAASALLAAFTGPFVCLALAYLYDAMQGASPSPLPSRAVLSPTDEDGPLPARGSGWVKTIAGKREGQGPE